MRILFIISTLGKGGAERVMSVLANELCKTHNISILKFDENEPFYEISSNVKIYSLKSGVGDKGVIGNLKKRFGKIFELRKFLKINKFDAVIPFLDSTNILVLLANLGLKNKVIISEHTNHTFLQNKILNLLKRALYPTANGLTVLTKFDKEYYQNFVRNVEILQNPMFGIDDEIYKKEDIILSAGRLISHKNFPMLLNALALIDKDLLKRWKVIIAGDGKERDNLVKKTKDLGLDVEFVGFVKDIQKYYKKAKIVAVTSNAEGFCNILMESIYFDCARISTSCVAGPSDLINNGVDGFLCEVNNEQEFAKKLESLIKDESLRDRFIQNARLRKSEFRVENIAKKWVEFIKICTKDNK